MLSELSVLHVALLVGHPVYNYIDSNFVSNWTFSGSKIVTMVIIDQKNTGVYRHLLYGANIFPNNEFFCLFFFHGIDVSHVTSVSIKEGYYNI